MRTVTIPLAAALLAVALHAPTAAAQVPGVNLQLVPKIGGYLPASDLGELSGTGNNQTELEAGLAIGLALELDLPLSPVNFRANFDYATGSEVSREGVSQDEGPETTLLALTGDLVFRPLPRIAVVQPYLLAGAGIKAYDFDTENVQDPDLRAAFADDRTDFTGHLGAGVDFTLGPAAVLVEVSDYISKFQLEDGGDSEWQNDLFAMIGFRVGLF